MKNKKMTAVVSVFMIIIISSVYFVLFQNNEENNLTQKEMYILPEVLTTAENYEILETDFTWGCVNNIYVGYSNGGPECYAVSVTGKGYRKDITMLIGIDKYGSVCGVKITGQKETKGKGTLIEDDSFLQQFIGLSSSGEKNSGGVRGTISDVEAISGATISSNAVKEGVEEALNAVSDIIS